MTGKPAGLTHSEYCIAITLALLVQFLLIFGLVGIVFSGQQLQSMRETLGVATGLFLGTTWWLAPDADHQRIRSILGANLEGCARIAPSLCFLTFEPDLGEDATSTAYAQETLRSSRVVQRDISPWLSWSIQAALVLIGGLIGPGFAKAFRVQDSRLTILLAVGVTIALIVPLLIWLDSGLDASSKRRLHALEILARRDPTTALSTLPFRSEAFTRKFRDDLIAAITIARSGESTLAAVRAARLLVDGNTRRAWTPSTLSNFSFGIGLFAAGIVIGALAA